MTKKNAYLLENFLPTHKIKEDFSKYFFKIRELDDYNYVLALLKFYTAPTIYGRKVGTLINLKSSGRDLKSCWIKHNTTFERLLKLDSIILKCSEDSVLVYLYQPQRLNNRLRDVKVKKFLLDYGYMHECDMQESLHILKKHFSGQSCPCEVGIFLGYPLEDVIAFKEKRCDCKCVGYWKCYNNVLSAKCKFFIYDLLKWFVTKQELHNFERAYNMT